VSDTESDERLTNLRFADDVLLVAGSLDDLALMIGDLIGEARKRGLELHDTKTKILSNVRDKDRAKKTPIDVAGMKIDILPYGGSVKYLGKELSFDRPTAKEVEHRISCACKKFYAQKAVLCNKVYPLAQRLRLFDTTITPTILYGAGSWTMTTELEHRLKKVHRRMLRSLFQCPRKKIHRDASSQSSDSSKDYEDVDSEDGDELEPWLEWIQRATHTIEEHYARIKLDDWVVAQRRRQHRWAGHVARRDDDRWPARLLNWLPEGGRRQGGEGRGRKQARPRRRWVNTLEETYTELGQGGWQAVAFDRNEWRKLEEDYAMRS
jgi:hypothetical protein